MRIAVIGNIGGGKTRLARHLALQQALPVFHVDSYQFLPTLEIRPHQETIKDLRQIQQAESWIIDGYGPLDILIERLELSDQIIFVDLPLGRHILWTIKRQIQNLWSGRPELPQGSSELSLRHTVKLFRSLWKIHTKMRPEMLRILGREGLRTRVIHVQSVQQLNKMQDSSVEFVYKQP